jgi:hypothetical protein
VPPSQFTVPDDLTFTSNAQNLLALKGTATPPAAIVFAPPTAVADASLSASTIAPSIDESNNALRIRAEYSNGTTLKTAIIPFQPASTITVGASGADFTTIQAAWDSLKGRLLQSSVTISVQAGTYNEAVLLNRQPFSELITIQGDTRSAAGQHFVTTGSITKSGSNCTITLTSPPPSDFTSSDYVVVGGAASAANVGRFAIVSIDAVNKTVTYANASGVAEALRADTQVIFCPNRIIDFTGLGNGVTSTCAVAPVLSGFTLLSSSSAGSGVLVPGAAALVANQCAAFNITSVGFQASDGGNLTTDAKCTAVKCQFGFLSTRGACVNASNTYASDSSSFGYAVFASVLMANAAVATNNLYGFHGEDCGAMYVSSSIASFNSNAGFNTTNNGFLLAASSTARNNVTGYQASWNALTDAPNTNVNNAGNTTNYSPATSGTAGNFEGLTQWS